MKWTPIFKALTDFFCAAPTTLWAFAIGLCALSAQCEPFTDHDTPITNQYHWGPRLRQIPDNFETFQSQIDNSIKLSTVNDVHRLYLSNVVVGNVINDRGIGSLTLDTRTLGLYLRVLKKGAESGLPVKEAQGIAAAYVGLFNNENLPDLPNLRKLKALLVLKPSELAKAIGELKKNGVGSGFLSALISLVDKVDPVEAQKLLAYADGQASIYFPEMRNIVEGKSYLKVPLKDLNTSEFVNSAIKDYYDLLGTEKGREALDTPFIREANGGKSPNSPLAEIRFANQKNNNNAAAETTYEMLAQMLPEQTRQSETLGHIEETTKQNSKKLDQVHGVANDIKKDTKHIRSKVDSIDIKLDDVASMQKAALKKIKGMDGKLDILVQAHLHHLTSQQGAVAEAIAASEKRAKEQRAEVEFNATLQSGYALTATLRALFPNDNGVRGFAEVAETGFEIRKIIFTQLQNAPELACGNIYMALLNLGLKLSGLTKNQKTDREVMIELFQKLEKQIRDLEFKITEMFRNTNENINLTRRNIDYQLSMLRAQITEDASSLQQQSLDLHRETNELVRLTLRQGENGRRQAKDEANERVGTLCQSLSMWRLKERMQNGESLLQSDIDRETHDCENRLSELHYFPSRNVYTRTFSGTERIDPQNANRYYTQLGKKLQESPIEENYGLLAQRLSHLGVPFHVGNGVTSPGTEALAPTEELAPLSDEKFFKSWTRAWNKAYFDNGPRGVVHAVPKSDPRLNLMRGVMKDQLRWMENYEHVAGLDSRGRVNPLVFGGLIHDNRDQLTRVFSTMSERLTKALHSSGHSLENYDLNSSSDDQPHDRVSSRDQKAADLLYQKIVEDGVIKPCPKYSPRDAKYLHLTDKDFHKLLYSGTGDNKPSEKDEKLFPSVFLTLYRMLKGEIRICYSNMDAVDERLEPLQTRTVEPYVSRPELLNPMTMALTFLRSNPTVVEIYEYKTARPGIVIQGMYQFPFGNNATIPIFSKIVPAGERMQSGGRVWAPVFDDHENVFSPEVLKQRFPGNAGAIDSATAANKKADRTFTGFRPQQFHGFTWDSLLPKIAEDWNQKGGLAEMIPRSKDYKINDQARKLYANVAKAAIDRLVSEKLSQGVKNHIADASGNGDAEEALGLLRDAMLGLNGARDSLTESLQIALGDSYYNDTKLQELVSKLPDQGVISKLLVANADGVGYEKRRDQIQQVLEKPLSDLLEYLLDPRIKRAQPAHRELERIFADSVGIYKTETNAMPQTLASEMIRMLPMPDKNRDEFDANERRRAGDFLYWAHFAKNGPKAPLSDSRFYLEKLQNLYRSKGSITPSELASAKELVRVTETKRKRDAEEWAFRNEVQKARKNYDEIYLSRIAEAETKLSTSSAYIKAKIAEAKTYLAGGNQFPDAGQFRQRQEPLLHNLEQVLKKVEAAQSGLVKSKESAEVFMSILESTHHRDELEKVKQSFARGPRNLTSKAKEKELEAVKTWVESFKNSQTEILSTEVSVMNGTTGQIRFRDSVAPTNAVNSMDLLARREDLAQLGTFDLVGPVEEAARLQQQADHLVGAIYGIQQEWKVDRSPPNTRHSSGGSGDGRF